VRPRRGRRWLHRALSVAVPLSWTRQPGARVVVLEAEHIGGWAPRDATQGMLGPGVGQEPGQPGTQIRPQQQQRSFTEQPWTRWADVRKSHHQRAPSGCDLRMSGHLILARGPGGRARLAATDRSAPPTEPPQGFPPLRRGAAARFYGSDLHCRMWSGQAGPDNPAFGPAAARIPFAGTLHPVRLARRTHRVWSAPRGGLIFEAAPPLSRLRSGKRGGVWRYRGGGRK